MKNESLIDNLIPADIAKISKKLGPNYSISDYTFTPDLDPNIYEPKLVLIGNKRKNNTPVKFVFDHYGLQEYTNDEYSLRNHCNIMFIDNYVARYVNLKYASFMTERFGSLFLTPTIKHREGQIEIFKLLKNFYKKKIKDLKEKSKQTGNSYIKAIYTLEEEIRLQDEQIKVTNELIQELRTLEKSNGSESQN